MARRRVLPEPVEKAPPDISLAIVNIVLLLIFFFLVSGSLTSVQGNLVTISETSDLPIEQLPRPVLTIEDDGSYSFNGEPAELADVADLMGDNRVLHLFVNRDAPALDLLEIIEDANLNAFELRLVTLHLREDP